MLVSPSEFGISSIVPSSYKAVHLKFAEDEQYVDQHVRQCGGPIDFLAGRIGRFFRLVT